MDDRLATVFRETFNHDALVLTDDLTAADIPEWDSLFHLSLLFRIEEEFGVEFDGDEAASLGNVGELKQLLRAKGCG